MSRQGRVLSDATWLRDVHDAQEGARAFRTALHLDWLKQRTESDFLVTVVRIWLITILLLVLGAVVAVILEKTGMEYSSTRHSSQIYQPEKK
jgi:hypothetical protein